MTFEFDDSQINMIVNALAQRPYGEVYELMANIQRQVTQLKQPAPQLVPGQTPHELVGT